MKLNLLLVALGLLGSYMAFSKGQASGQLSGCQMLLDRVSDPYTLATCVDKNGLSVQFIHPETGKVMIESLEK
jgi:hypothetical protein